MCVCACAHVHACVHVCVERERGREKGKYMISYMYVTKLTMNILIATKHTSETYSGCSLVPRPPPFFVLQFAFSIIHGSRRARKTGKAWEHLSRE